MIGESLAVVTVILVMATMYLRAGKKTVALLALPLCGVSAGFLIAALLRRPLLIWLHLSIPALYGAGVLLGLLAGMTLSVLLSKGMGRRVRGWYLILSWIFLLAITAAYFLRFS